MKILITNDDGIDCDGLWKLQEALLQKQHEVWIVVPDKNRSGVSHGITMYEPTCLKMLRSNVFTCSGYPVDCVVNGIHAIMKTRPDVIISGINKGANLGTDVVFSGTAAGAREAALLGYNGIAVSLDKCTDNSSEWNFKPLAKFVADNLENLVPMCQKDIFLNINAMNRNSYEGACFANVTKRSYNDNINLYEIHASKKFSFFVGGVVHDEPQNNGDCEVVKKGFVAITRLCAQPVAADCSEFQNIDFIV